MRTKLALTKPRVWMIIPTYHPVIGGAQTQVERLAQVLTRRGWQVQVLTRQHSGWNWLIYTFPLWGLVLVCASGGCGVIGTG